MNSPIAANPLCDSSALPICDEAACSSETKATQVVGRDQEIQVLLDAYERSTASSSSTQELVLIQGRSGFGKTVLATAIRPAVQKDSGFFLTGKFELSRTQAPFAVFVHAFTEWVNLVVVDNGENESSQRSSSSSAAADDRLPQFREAILKAVGKEGKLLTDLIPSLTLIIGEQEDMLCEVTAAESVQRLQFIFGKFCSAISSIAPVVLLLDDLQWSDKASLDLFDVLLHPTSAPSGMLILGTFRDVEVEANDIMDHEGSGPLIMTKHPFSRFLLEKKLLSDPPPHLTVSEVSLTTIDVSSVGQIIASTLDVPLGTTTKLAEYLHSQCGGNVFHIMIRLRVLLDRNIVFRDDVKESVVFREDEQLSVGEDESVDEIVRHTILRTTGFTQEVLKVAACIGDEIDESALATVLDGRLEDILQSLKSAMQIELLTFTRHVGRFRFRHDRTRQAVLSLVDDVDALSFDVGYKLWKGSSTHFAYTKIFVIANLLLQGTNKITDKDDRIQIATYHLEAGIQASALAAFPDASRYLEAGIKLLGGLDNMWSDHYSLALQLHNWAVDAALCNQDFDRVAVLVDEIIAHGRTCRDKLTAYTAKVNAAGQNGSMQLAVDVGFQVLEHFGVHLKSNPGLFSIIREIIKTKLAIRGRSDFDILTLPPMQDESKLAAMHVLQNILPYAFQLGSPCSVTITTTLVQLTMKFGLSKLASKGFANLAWVVCRSERKEGYRLGQLAMEIIQKHRATELIPNIHSAVYFFVNPWTQPLRSNLEPLQKAYYSGMEIGDVEHATYASAFRSAILLFSGVSLLTVEDAYTIAIAHMTHHKQTNALALTVPNLQYVHNLMGRAPDPKILAGSIFNPTQANAEIKLQLGICCELEAALAYRFGDFDLAQSAVEKRRALPENPCMYPYALDYFHDGLIAAALVRVGKPRHRRKYVNQLRQSFRKTTAWTKDCPHNFRHKLKLLEAELRSLCGRRSADSKVVVLYQEAIDCGLNEGFQHEAALAAELAGDYLYRYGDMSKAEEYWNQAYELNIDWGATAKANHLRERTVSMLQTSHAEN